MTSIDCISTSNQFDTMDNKDQQTRSDLTCESTSFFDVQSNSTQRVKEILKVSPEKIYQCDKNQSQPFSPFSPNYQTQGDNEIIISAQLPIITEQQKIQEEEEFSYAPAILQQNNNKLIEESEEEEEDDDFPAPRQKSNTFSAGYISTHIPCEQKKSQFGLLLNLNIKNSFIFEDNDIMNPEVDSSNDYDSTDDSYSAGTINAKSNFAKRRSSFFKNFKPESLRLITPIKDETTQKTQSIIKRENFEEKFEIHEKLGEGCHSIVRRCCMKDDSPLQSYAVKIIAYKDPEYLFEILQEERVLSLLSHKNIIKYNSFFLEKEKKKAYIVSEYACGKPLGQYVQNKKQFSMREICSIAKQTLKAIAHMHSKGIIHRDLSYNNIMYDPQTETVKVIDFTVSKIVTIQKLLTNTGTLNFKAPEMLSGTFYSHSIDIFALGVNLFALIFGSLPFNDSNDKKVIENIINKNPLEFYKNQLNFDACLLNFMEGLLEKNPLKRMTALQALKHPWLNKKVTCDDFKTQKFRKTLKNGISASTVAELDDDETDQDTFTSINLFMVKTLANLQDD